MGEARVTVVGTATAAQAPLGLNFAMKNAVVGFERIEGIDFVICNRRLGMAMARFVDRRSRCQSRNIP